MHRPRTTLRDRPRSTNPKRNRLDHRSSRWARGGRPGARSAAENPRPCRGPLNPPESGPAPERDGRFFHQHLDEGTATPAAHLQALSTRRFAGHLLEVPACCAKLSPADRPRPRMVMPRVASGFIHGPAFPPGAMPIDFLLRSGVCSFFLRDLR